MYPLFVTQVLECPVYCKRTKALHKLLQLISSSKVAYISLITNTRGLRAAFAQKLSSLLSKGRVNTVKSCVKIEYILTFL